MKILPISDVHIEHKVLIDKFVDTLADADVLVIAGDLTDLRFVERFCGELSHFMKRYKNIVYVPGNHEYYGTSIGDAHIILEAAAVELNAAGKRFHVLHPGQTTTIDGQRFIGATMWFPDGPRNAFLGPKLMNDFRLIKGLVPFVYDHNKSFRAQLNSELSKDDIVVTHHLPSFNSVPNEYKNDVGNIFYVSNQADVILDKQPKLWIHGHTHRARDYEIGKTRVVCNPKGYPHEVVGGNFTGFNPNLVIEV